MRWAEDRLHQPLRRDLAVAPEIQIAVVREDLLAVRTPVSRDLPPRHLREHMMYGVQVVVEEEHAPEDIRFRDRGALPRPVAVAMLGKRTHPAESKRRPCDEQHV